MSFLERDWQFQTELLYRKRPELPETAERNREILLGALDGLVAGDVSAFWAIFDPDVVFHEADCLPYGGAHHGLVATQRVVDEISSTYSYLRTEFEEVMAAGTIALLYQIVDFKVRETGIECKMPVSELYRFRDGKVIEWRAMYFDAAAVAQAMIG